MVPVGCRAVPLCASLWEMSSDLPKYIEALNEVDECVSACHG